MSNPIYANLLEPSFAAKKKSMLRTIQTGSDVQPDVESVKQKLQDQRTAGVKNLSELSKQFVQTLQRDSSISCHLAQKSSDAAQLIASELGDTKMLFANNSGTVQELEPALGAKGIDVSYNYLLERNVHENRLAYPWLLPGSNIQPGEEWVSVQKKFPLNKEAGERECNGATVLIGVNSAAADDGSLFLLQHTSNIERLLQAHKIIFLVGMEKIVANREEAIFQTAWAGNFGLHNLLMNLTESDTEEKGEKEGQREKNEKSENLSLFEEKKSAVPEVTVIVLDNGRSGLTGTAYEPALRCISCRSCMRECPNYKFFGKEKGRYPQQYLFHFLLGDEKNLDLCSFCNNCTFECPVGIDIAKMNSLAKGGAHSPLARWKTRLLGNAELLANATRFTLPVSEPLFKHELFRKAGHSTIGIHQNRLLPVYDRVKLKRPVEKSEPVKTVIYYPGCWSAFFEHEVYNAVITLFDLLDYQVIIADSKCCGLPLIASGEVDAARDKGGRLVRSLLKLDTDLDIITTCPSCSLALKEDYQALGVEDADKISGRVFDVLEYILSLDELKNGTLKFSECRRNLAYHLPCHQRVQGLNSVALETLKNVPGLTVTDVERGCCGISGAWGNKTQFYDYSMVTGREVFEAIDPEQFNGITTECGTCKMQMVHGTGMETLHPITILADTAYIAP